MRITFYALRITSSVGEVAVNYDDWEKNVSPTITGDSLWKLRAYQLALFLADIGWQDVTKLSQDPRTVRLSDQLYRALGSIGANIAEGYSRSSDKDQARFYEYALGSTRESRDWYFKARHILGLHVAEHRMQFLTEIARLLLVIIPQKRGRILRETQERYETASPNPNKLLEQIPF
jgi:four helix bundle protein